MAQIITLEQFRDWIKNQLGYPVIIPEIDDTQIDNCIDYAVKYFQQYNIGEGSNLEYMLFNTVSGQSVYDMSGQNILGAFDVELSIGIDGINTLFSPTHEILYSDFVQKGSIFTGGQPDYSPGLVLTTYDSAMMYLKEIKNKFGKGYVVRYNQNKEELTIVPTPSEALTGVLYFYRKEDAINLYNNILVEDLALARAKWIWGQILGKYTVTMPDGTTINGEALRTEGKEDMKTAEEAMSKQSEPPDIFFG